ETPEERHIAGVANLLDVAPAPARREIMLEDFDRADGARTPPSGDVLALGERFPDESAGGVEDAGEGDDRLVGRKVNRRIGHGGSPCWGQCLLSGTPRPSSAR